MRLRVLAVTATLLVQWVAAVPAMAQGGGSLFRLRARFRTQTDQSAGNADFRVIERFGSQVYYGPVIRMDRFKFKVQIQMAPPISTFPIFINDIEIGSVTTDATGFGQVQYDSRWQLGDPDLPLPSNFPDVVNVGDVVRVGNLFSATLLERFRRGDHNQDGVVDVLDLSQTIGTWGSSSPIEDVTQDGVVDVFDLAMLLGNWG